MCGGRLWKGEHIKISIRSKFEREGEREFYFSKTSIFYQIYDHMFAKTFERNDITLQDLYIVNIDCGGFT